MTAYQFSQPWLSKLGGDQDSNALEWAHLRDYLKGIDNGTISLFNPNFLNFSVNGAPFKTPVPIASGGTNSTTALVNGLLIASAGGKIGEIGADTSVGSHKLTSLSNGTASSDAAAFGQLKIIQIVYAISTSAFTTTSTSFQSTNATAFIIPTSASNKVLILACSEFDVSSTSLTSLAYSTIFRGSTDLGNADTTSGFKFVFNTISNVTNNSSGDGVIIHVDAPATTSSTTYTVKVRAGAASTTVAYPLISGEPSIMVLMEIVA